MARALRPEVPRRPDAAVAARARLRLALRVLALALPALAPAAGEEPRRLRAESDRYRVTLLDEGESCCPREIELAVTERATGTSRRLRVSGRIRELQRLHLFEDRLAVVGELRHRARTLLIVDLTTGRQEERIWAYDLAISPGGRFVVYRTHYPPYGIPAGRRSIVLLYDLTKSAEENRGGARREYPCANAGTPLFPKASAARGDPCIRDVADRLWVSPFLWSADERRVVFVECGVDWKRCDLVALELGEPGRPPAVRRRRLELTPYIRREGPFGYSGEPGHPVPIAVESLTWKDDRTVSIVPTPSSGLASPIEISLP